MPTVPLTCVRCGKPLRADNRSGYCYKDRAYAKLTAYGKQANCDRSRKNHAEFRLKIAAIKLDRGCADCGYDRYAEALDFDHLPGVEKVKSVALMWGYAWETALAEIAKCEVVCSNCHRHRTKVRKDADLAAAALAASETPRATPRILGPAQCGTPSGYNRHRKQGEKPCAACGAAAAAARSRNYRARAIARRAVTAQAPLWD